MPELPEVETIIRGLARRIVNRRISGVELLFPQLIVGDPEDAVLRLRSSTITAIHRHGKYIIIGLAKRKTSFCLVVHLRMTGNFVLDGDSSSHTRAIVQLEGGPAIVYHDIRKFGRWQVADELPPRLRELGPDPLEIAGNEFIARLRSHRAMAKALLLNQEFLRGLGNIYADEALFRARIHPKANTARIGRRRATRLYEGIQQVLTEAITQGGSTINNYVNSEGTQGYFQLSTLVYGKTGEPCKVCDTPIRRTVVASRGTHFCAVCQRR